MMPYLRFPRLATKVISGSSCTVRYAVFLAVLFFIEPVAGEEPLLSIPRIPDALKLAEKKDVIWVWMDSGRDFLPGCGKALAKHEGHLILSPGYDLALAQDKPRGGFAARDGGDFSPKALKFIATHRGPVTLFFHTFTSECADALVDHTCDMTINVKECDPAVISRFAERKNGPLLHLNLSSYMWDEVKRDLGWPKSSECNSMGYHIGELVEKGQHNPRITITHHRELRRWADMNEKKRYDAQYQSIDANRNVRLRLLDKTIKEIPLDELRGGDRVFVLCAQECDRDLAEWNKKQREAAAKPADPFRPVVEEQRAEK